MKANLELHIDELVLYGLPAWQREHIAAAVEAELGRLLEKGGLAPALAQGGRLPEVQVGDLQIAVGAEPGAIGAQIAGSIYNSLSGEAVKPGRVERSTL